MSEKRIYVIVAATVDTDKGLVVQPAGRQIAQACHAANEVRVHNWEDLGFQITTTIILQARNTAELEHVYNLLFEEGLNPVSFEDRNPEYGGECTTAIAVYASFEDVIGLSDYLPLWGYA